MKPGEDEWTLRQNPEGNGYHPEDGRARRSDGVSRARVLTTGVIGSLFGGTWDTEGTRLLLGTC